MLDRIIFHKIYGFGYVNDKVGKTYSVVFEDLTLRHFNEIELKDKFMVLPFAKRISAQIYKDAGGFISDSFKKKIKDIEVLEYFIERGYLCAKFSEKNKINYIAYDASYDKIYQYKDYESYIYQGRAVIHDIENKMYSIKTCSELTIIKEEEKTFNLEIDKKFKKVLDSLTKEHEYDRIIGLRQIEEELNDNNIDLAIKYVSSLNDFVANYLFSAILMYSEKLKRYESEIYREYIEENQEKIRIFASNLNLEKYTEVIIYHVIINNIKELIDIDFGSAGNNLSKNVYKRMLKGKDDLEEIAKNIKDFSYPKILSYYKKLNDEEKDKFVKILLNHKDNSLPQYFLEVVGEKYASKMFPKIQYTWDNKYIIKYIDKLNKYYDEILDKIISDKMDSEQIYLFSLIQERKIVKNKWKDYEFEFNKYYKQIIENKSENYIIENNAKMFLNNMFLTYNNLESIVFSKENSDVFIINIYPDNNKIRLKTKFDFNLTDSIILYLLHRIYLNTPLRFDIKK